MFLIIICLIGMVLSVFYWATKSGHSLGVLAVGGWLTAFLLALETYIK